jgi:hypothetical protein
VIITGTWCAKGGTISIINNTIIIIIIPMIYSQSMMHEMYVSQPPSQRSQPSKSLPHNASSMDDHPDG